MKNIKIGGVVALAALLLMGCGAKSSDNAGQTMQDVEQQKVEQEVSTADAGEGIQVASEVPEMLEFVDVYGETYQVAINPNVKSNSYDKEAFVLYGNRMLYENREDYSYRLGVDVSHYQGEIDWEKVKSAGIEFAIIRLGFRGYGEEGVIKLDTNFEKNMKGARAAGLDVGVYFFAQAVNEQEAVEEAEFVLENLLEYDLQMPVVYDPESILHEEARTDDVTGEQFTKNTKAFCETIKKAGYDPMVYCNMLWQAYELDLEALSDYPIWYADYEPTPQTPYHFDIWQYTSEGTVDGIQGNVDLNIQMIKK